MGRPSRPLLSREGIARAALELVDEQGADGLTMRAIAERLGVKAASLYNHTSGKDELIDALAELVNAEIDLTHLAAAQPGAEWRGAVADYARSYRAAFLRHPNTIALLARRQVGAERQLLGYEALLSALDRAGLAPADAAEAAAALDYLVLGSALETFTAGFTCPADDYRPAYPALATALAASTERDTGAGTGTGSNPSGLDDRGFELALRLLLDGLAARLTTA
ncbi:TetR/AcrR family transcriptional regulator C-terminal domain-containing protein [Kitasatospora sp. NPDC002227]|uniref:TetR/AcrR family transcriptional regulator n=1 Tax=Kitasatospora sp. NPDC002227 TaxID=3154773 RepID=UPI00331BF050